MVGCVLTHTPHKCDITKAFIKEVEKVERKQCDNIHSSVCPSLSHSVTSQTQKPLRARA